MSAGFGWRGGEEVWTGYGEVIMVRWGLVVVVAVRGGGWWGRHGCAEVGALAKTVLLKAHDEQV